MTNDQRLTVIEERIKIITDILDLSTRQDYHVQEALQGIHDVLKTLVEHAYVSPTPTKAKALEQADAAPNLERKR